MMKVLGILLAALVAWVPAAIAVVAEGRWQRLENDPSCRVWNAGLQAKPAVTWRDACANGKTRGRGVLVLANGDRSDRYEGGWKDGKRHGRGVKVWANGDRYEGEFRDGNRTGRGVLVWGPNSQRAGDRYEGDWKDGKRTGRGVIVFANGNRYEGGFRDNKYNGRGVFVFPNGDNCEGDWREDRLLGTGEGWVNGEIKKCYMDGNTIKYTD